MKKLVLISLLASILFAKESPKHIAYWSSWNGMNIETAQKVARSNNDGILLSFGKWDAQGNVQSSDNHLSIPEYDKDSVPNPYSWTYAKYLNPNIKFLVAYGGQTYEEIWDTLATQEGRVNVVEGLYNVVTTRYPVYKKGANEDEIIECKSSNGGTKEVWSNDAGEQQVDSDGNLMWKDWLGINPETGNYYPDMTGAMIEVEVEVECNTAHNNIVAYVELDGLDFDFEKAARITEQESENLRLTIQMLRNKLTENSVDKLLSLTTYHVGADPEECSDNTIFKDCSFIETSRSKHHGEVKQLLNDSIGLFDFYNVMSYDAGYNFRYDVSLKNYANIVGSEKVNMGITINNQWAWDGKMDTTFVETRVNNINRAKFAKDNGYNGFFIWNYGASTQQMSFDDQVLYMEDLITGYNIGNSTYTPITDEDLESDKSPAPDDGNDESPEPDNTTNLIVNGSFEEYTILRKYRTKGRGEGHVNDWTITNNRGVFDIWLSGAGQDATDGIAKLELDLRGQDFDKISQTINTANDKVYSFSIDAYARTIRSSDFSVKVNGVEVMRVVPIHNTWGTYTTTFVGSGSDIISIEELKGQDNGYGAIIDNVVVKLSDNQNANFRIVQNYAGLDRIATVYVSKEDFMSRSSFYTNDVIKWLAPNDKFVLKKELSNSIKTYSFGGGCISNVDGYAIKTSCSSHENQKLSYFNQKLENNNGLCLEPKSNNNGSRVIYSTCDNTSKQNWLYEVNKQRFRHNDSNRCLDISGSNKYKAIIWNCHNGRNQQFVNILQ